MRYSNIVVVSLFDGISVLRQSLKELGVKPLLYISYEIDKNAIKISEDNHKDIIRLGNVLKADYANLNKQINILKTDYPGIKVLLVGGSPCQSFSFAGNRKGLENVLTYKDYQAITDKSIFTGQSWLFWELVRAKKELEHDYFIMENVVMEKSSKDLISDVLSLEPIMINSNLVSYQNRKRLYWMNKQIPIPKDRQVSFQDYREITEDFRPLGKWVYSKWSGVLKIDKLQSITTDKVGTITTKRTHSHQYYLNPTKSKYRNLTICEIEQAQTLPIGYTKSVSMTNGVKGIGNSFTNEVIKHILTHLIF